MKSNETKRKLYVGFVLLTCFSLTSVPNTAVYPKTIQASYSYVSMLVRFHCAKHPNTNLDPKGLKNGALLSGKEWFRHCLYETREKRSLLASVSQQDREGRSGGAFWKDENTVLFLSKGRRGKLIYITEDIHQKLVQPLLHPVLKTVLNNLAFTKPGLSQGGTKVLVWSSRVIWREKLPLNFVFTVLGFTLPKFRNLTSQIM